VRASNSICLRAHDPRRRVCVVPSYRFRFRDKVVTWFSAVSASVLMTKLDRTIDQALATQLKVAR
jgi:hypothetical protein